MQRKSRFVVIQMPTGNPYTRTASTEYCEQVGEKRQWTKSEEIGLTSVRYGAITVHS